MALPASEGEQRKHHRAGGRDSPPSLEQDASHSANACAPLTPRPLAGRHETRFSTIFLHYAGAF